MGNNERLFVDVHVLQTVPPSCVNRDDTGSPKTAVYGGVTRARVSSQCWKKAVRDIFKEENLFPRGCIGVRTKKYLVPAIAQQIRDIDSSIDEKESKKLALDTVNIASKDAEKPIIPKPDKDSKEEDDKSAALFFITPKQVQAVAELAVKWKRESTEPSKDAVIEALNKDQGIDIAMFGRLVARAPKLNVDACVQVAHSISTHKVSNEYDYFTAVDDLEPKDNVGAGYIGTAEFNSSTLYRYATVAVHELKKQLGGDTIDAVREFVRAFVCSMPTGKQNTFANRTMPDALLVTVRTDQPLNLVGAFEKPVQATDNGYVSESAKRLIAHTKNVYRDFAREPAVSLVTGEQLAELGKALPLNELLKALEDELRKRLGNGGDGK